MGLTSREKLVMVHASGGVECKGKPVDKVSSDGSEMQGLSPGGRRFRERSESE